MQVINKRKAEDATHFIPKEHDCEKQVSKERAYGGMGVLEKDVILNGANNCESNNWRSEESLEDCRNIY